MTKLFVGLSDSFNLRACCTLSDYQIPVDGNFRLLWFFCYFLHIRVRCFTIFGLVKNQMYLQ